jgi:ATPase
MEKKTQLESFFDNTTMSVHLRENAYPFAKKGAPGNWDFVKIKNSLMSQGEIEEISNEIIEEVEGSDDGFIEIERVGSTIIQLGTFRIVITRPPFSDGWEITAVRPVKHLELKEYELSEKLIKRLEDQAEGILIAGAPGMGKSTFAAALIEYYASKGKVVKTVEAPRDLVLPDQITQYAISHGSSEEVHDILLLSRPDYTLFDEMRNKDDFSLFADLRLSGIGLAGVVHATNPVDAIQRFVGKIDLGVIPHVIDTVIFIKDGQINKILSLQIEVKVPSGMTEADLARPIVTVKDFETGKLEYELYSYGEETVVVPVQEAQIKSTGAKRLAAIAIKDEFLRYSDRVDVEVISENKAIVRVPDYSVAGIIGKAGSHINKIEELLGISIDVEELPEYEGKKKGKKKKKNKRR